MTSEEPITKMDETFYLVCHFSQSANATTNKGMLRRFELKSLRWIQPAFVEISAEARKMSLFRKVERFAEMTSKIKNCRFLSFLIMTVKILNYEKHIPASLFVLFDNVYTVFF